MLSINLLAKRFAQCSGGDVDCTDRFLNVMFFPSSMLMKDPVCLGMCEHMLCRYCALS